MTPKRDWTQAIKKRTDTDGNRCRVCHSLREVEMAHVIGRAVDRYQPLREAEHWRPYVVHPDRIVALCRDHHRDYDAHKLDLLPHLEVWEVLQAVADCALNGRSNGFEQARLRLTGDLAAVAV